MFKKKIEKKPRKLNLTITEIRFLSNVDLKEVAGGTSGTCSDTGPDTNCKPF